MNIQERLAVFYARLRDAPAAKSAEEAFWLICRTLDEVENEFCSVPKTDPPPRRFEGRMYSPQPDNIMVQEDGSWLVRTRRHRISIRSNGDFIISRLLDDQRLAEQFRKVKTEK